MRAPAPRRAALFALLAALPAVASDTGRQALFSCTTDAVADRGFLAISARQGDDGAWSQLRFERGADGSGHVVDAFAGPFHFSHSDGPEGYLVTLRWQHQGREHLLYSLAIPPAGEGDAGGGAAGLESGRGARVDCAERPHLFIDYLRRASACDRDPPVDGASCGAAPGIRKAPLPPKRFGQ